MNARFSLVQMSYLFGWLFAGRLQKHSYIRYLHHRVRRFDLKVFGLEQMKGLAQQSFLLVSNHAPVQDVYFPNFPYAHKFKRFTHPVDSFIWRRLVLETLGKPLCVIVRSDRGFYSKPAALRWLERHLFHPFSRGRLEAAGFIPLSLIPGAFHRSFLNSADRAIQRRSPILVFPEGNCYTEFSADNPFEMGAAHLAQKYQLPIIPAYIHRGTYWNPKGSIFLYLAEPLDPKGLSKAEINDLIRQQILHLQTKAKTAYSALSVSSAEAI